MSSFLEHTRKPVGNGDRLMRFMMNRGHAAMAKWGFSHIVPSRADLALDIGCGGGANLVRLLAMCPDGCVTGADYSEISVENPKSLRSMPFTAVDAGWYRRVFLHYSGENSFHLVTAFETVYFWPEIDHAFRQVYRVLKPGGQFLICNEADGLKAKNARWTKKIPGMTIYNAGQLKRFLANAGFTDIRIAREAEKHWLCVTARKAAI